MHDGCHCPPHGTHVTGVHELRTVPAMQPLLHEIWYAAPHGSHLDDSGLLLVPAAQPVLHGNCHAWPHGWHWLLKQPTSTPEIVAGHLPSQHVPHMMPHGLHWPYWHEYPAVLHFEPTQQPCHATPHSSATSATSASSTR